MINPNTTVELTLHEKLIQSIANETALHREIEHLHTEATERLALITSLRLEISEQDHELANHDWHRPEPRRDSRQAPGLGTMAFLLTTLLGGAGMLAFVRLKGWF